MKIYQSADQRSRRPAAYADGAATMQRRSKQAVRPYSLPVLSAKHPEIVQRSPTRALPLEGGIADDDAEVKRGKKVQVGGDRGAWLEKGSQVIALIKLLLLPYGSGNVRQSIKGSNAESITRLTAFRNMSYLDPGKTKPPVTVGTQQIKDLKRTEDIVQAALAAAVVKGGNCLQNGEIAYALLNLMLPGGTDIALVQPGGCDHAFTVIGNVPANGRVTRDMAAQLVCVDAWPHVAKACLLSDSEFGTWENAYVVKGTAQGGGQAKPFFDQIEQQKQLATEFAQSTDTISDRGIRSQRQSLRTALRTMDAHTPRVPTVGDMEGAFDNMTIFKDDVVPEYITPSHPDFDPNL